jgi:tetratricopeptide (TPR) repeat protein
MPRENYYIMVGLDPDRDTTWDAIAPKLSAKRNEWSQQSISHPTRKNEFKQKLDEYPNIERVLKDDGTRKQEADEARVLIRERDAAALADLEDKVRVTASKGYLTSQDVKALIAQGQGRWREPDVSGLATKLKIPIQDRAPGRTEPIGPRIDNVEPIERNLKFLKSADLYEFLGATRTASARMLKDLADRKYQEQRNLPKSPEVTATQELIGHCLKLFESESERTRYDNTLKWLELAEIRRLAEMAGTGEGKIAAGVTEELIRRGKKEGLAQDVVVAAVREVADRRKWLVEVPMGGVVETLTQRCGWCRELATATAAHCPNSSCGRPLKHECPSCKTQNPTDARTCLNSKCSFAIGDMPFAERTLRDAKGLIQSDPVRAKSQLREALTFWPGHPEAVRLLGEITRREQEIEQYVAAVEAARREKAYYVAVRSAVEALAREAPNHPRLAEYRKELSDVITSADALVLAARALEQMGKSDDAIDAYEKALHVCSDHPEAKSGLSRCPPDPPSLPACRATAAGVTISWKANPSRRPVTFRVVRKIGSQPSRVGDGDPLGQPPVSPFTDQTAEPGQSYYYGVFADRGGIPSTRPAVVGPVVRVAEVTGLRPKIVGDGRVELEWKAPKNLRRVEIWRQAQSEPKIGEGERVTNISDEWALDQRVTNGIPYGYRVVAVFAGPDGKELASEGSTCMATPVAPPKPITDLKVYRIGGGLFEVSWSRPTTGDVRIYQIADPRDRRPRTNQVLATADLDQLGKRVELASATTARGQLQQATELHLLPVTILGQVAVLGQLVSTNWVDDVDELKAWPDGTRLRATWRFPDGFDHAVVAFRTDRYPERPDDPGAKIIHWTRDQSRLDGGFQCPLPQAEQVFLTVYSVINRNGQPQFSAGKQQNVPVTLRRRVRYRVVAEKKMMLATGRWLVVLEPDGPVQLPALVLVARDDGYPLSPTDGRHSFPVPPQSAAPGSPIRHMVSPPPNLDVRNTRLFPVALGEAGWLELVRES